MPVCIAPTVMALAGIIRPDALKNHTGPPARTGRIAGGKGHETEVCTVNPWRILLLLAALAGAMLALVLHARLPHYVAIHFDWRGVSDNWGNHAESLSIILGAHALATLSVLLLPSLMRRLPWLQLSFPLREYWFAPGRRESTLALLTPWFDALGVLLNAFLTGLEILVYRAHRHEPAWLEMRLFWGLVMAFVVLELVWTAALYRRFGRA